jgi:hypothetical protein
MFETNPVFRNCPSFYWIIYEALQLFERLAQACLGQDVSDMFD